MPNQTEIAENHTVSTPVETCASPRAAGEVPESSRLVIRDETTNKPLDERLKLALIDWLSFTVPPLRGRDWKWLRDCLQDVFNIQPQAWIGTNKSWSGYKHRVDLIHPGERGESINLGIVGYGGKSQRGTMHVSLNAQACARVSDWQLVMEWGDSVGAHPTRVDCAHDDIEGKILTIKQVRQWYDEGRFSANGRPPVAELIDDLDSGKGKTFYIGNRINGKFARFYEKGKKEGDVNSPWVRAEIEFKNTSRFIPWDIVVNPAQYLAGAYPCLAYLSVEQSRIKTIKKSASINYEKMSKWVKTSAGRALNVMLQVEGDAENVMKQVRRDGAPKRLEPYIGMPDAMPGRTHANPES